jgi:hypothetical protein
LFVPARRADRRLDVADGRDDLEAVLGLEQQLQAAAHDRVIVGQHDPDRCGVGGRSLHARSTLSPDIAIGVFPQASAGLGRWPARARFVVSPS